MHIHSQNICSARTPAEQRLLVRQRTFGGQVLLMGQELSMGGSLWATGVKHLVKIDLFFFSYQKWRATILILAKTLAEKEQSLGKNMPRNKRPSFMQGRTIIVGRVEILVRKASIRMVSIEKQSLASLHAELRYVG